jgi:predicted negative regulator of RcsB-dependent stress response
MLVTNFFLASMQGVKAKSAFAAREKSESAIVRLRDLPPDVRDVKEALFEAYVVHALAEHHVGDVRAADRLLWQARSLQPPQAETNPMYLFVAGLVEPRVLRKLRLLRRSAELDPDFELARAVLAFNLEELWRSRGQFEPSVARMLCDEYESVVSLNPGNVGVWGSLGYVNWLLADSPDEGIRVRYWRQSKRAFEAGRDYKQVRGETLTAELDHGLTRLAAEQGQFDEAYQYYLSTVSMQLSEYTLDYSMYFYGRGGDALLNRFSTYRDNVARQLGIDGAKPGAELDRVRRSVWAFVLNDIGQANVFYYYRSGSQAALEDARNAFAEAATENPDFVLPHYNLARLFQHLFFRDRHVSELAESHLETAHEEIEKCLRLEPEWPVAKLAMVEIEWEQVRLLRRREKSLEDEAERAARSRRTIIGMLGDGDGAGPPISAPISDRERPLDHKVADLQAEAARVREASGELLDHAAMALASLLPHPCFIEEGDSGDGGRSLVDASGGAVERILTSDIAWRTELDKLHVDTLVRWAQLLEASGTEEAVRAAEALTGHVELNFLPSDVGVLSTRRDAAGRIGLADVAHDCADRISYVVKHELDGDPAHYTVLLWSVFLDPREHVDALHRAIEAQGATGPTLLWLGQRFETEFSDATAAERAYRAAMSKDDRQVAYEAAFRLGGLLAGRGDTSGARGAYETATRSEDPGLATQAAAELGELLDGAGEQEEKERIFKLVAGRSPDGAAQLGAALEARGDLDGAEAAYRAASRRKSKLAAGAALSLGGILERKGWVRRAETAYRRASQSEESSVYAPAALRLGALLAARGDKPGAEEAYRKASGSDDQDAAPEAAVSLGRLLDERGAHDEAAPVYDHVAGLGALAAIRLGDLLAGHDLEAAEAAYLRGSEFENDSYMPMALLRLGDIRQSRGDEEGAAEAWQEASNSDDSGVFPVASLRLAEALTGSDREAAAEQAYRRAMESGSSDVAPHAAVKLFDMLTARGETAEAATLYEAVVALGARAAVTLGQLLQARGESQAAERAYRHGASLDGDAYAPDAQLGLGGVLEARGDAKGAEEAYRRALDSHDWTVSPFAALRLGDLLSRAGDPVGAEDMYRQAGESAHPGAYPAAALRLGELLSERGDAAGAEAAYRQAADSGDPTVAEEAEKRLAVPR